MMDEKHQQIGPESAAPRHIPQHDRSPRMPAPDLLDDELAYLAPVLVHVNAVHQFHGEDCLCGFSSARSRSRTEHITEALAAALRGLLARARAETWDECVDHICSPEESGTANRRRFKRANPHRPEPTWHAHTGCGRRVESGVVHYSCGIAVERGDYEGGVYAEHLRIAELEAGR